MSDRMPAGMFEKIPIHPVLGKPATGSALPRDASSRILARSEERMATGSFTLMIEAEERDAETMAWVCEKAFGTGVLFQPARSAGGRAWSVTVDAGRSRAGGRAGGVGETGEIGHLIDLLMDAAGPTGQVRDQEPPQRRVLRHKLDLVLRGARSLRAEHRGTRIAIQLPGSDPVSIDAVGSDDILDLLDA
jgi:hypothetical protein